MYQELKAWLGAVPKLPPDREVPYRHQVTNDSLVAKSLRTSAAQQHPGGSKVRTHALHATMTLM